MEKSTMRQHMSERFGKVFHYMENPPLPASLNIELNNNCNQSCLFCPFHGKYAKCRPKPAVMDYAMVKKILDSAKELGIGNKELGFYLAGEAFLYKDLEKAVEYAKSLGFKYTFITTNGALATPDRMKAILDAGLDSIRFSVNASDRNTYKMIHGKDDFEAVLDNIKFTYDYIRGMSLQTSISLSCVITGKTKNLTKKIKEVFGKYMDDIIFIPVIVDDRLQHDEKFIAEYQLRDDLNMTVNRDYICPILFDTMYINAELQVMPCCETYGPSGVFYDLKEDFNLEHAWNSSMYKRHRNIFLKGADDKGTICENCIARKRDLEDLFSDG